MSIRKYKFIPPSKLLQTKQQKPIIQKIQSNEHISISMKQNLQKKKNANKYHNKYQQQAQTCNLRNKVYRNNSDVIIPQNIASPSIQKNKQNQMNMIKKRQSIINKGSYRLSRNSEENSMKQSSSALKPKIMNLNGLISKSTKKNIDKIEKVVKPIKMNIKTPPKINKQSIECIESCQRQTISRLSRYINQLRQNNQMQSKHIKQLQNDKNQLKKQLQSKIKQKVHQKQQIHKLKTKIQGYEQRKVQKHHQYELIINSLKQVISDQKEEINLLQQRRTIQQQSSNDYQQMIQGNSIQHNYGIIQEQDESEVHSPRISCKYEEYFNQETENAQQYARKIDKLQVSPQQITNIIENNNQKYLLKKENNNNLIK